MTRRIRVLSLIDNLHFGGDENRLLVFAQTIDRRRFDHLIVTVSGANTEVDRALRRDASTIPRCGSRGHLAGRAFIKQPSFIYKSVSIGAHGGGISSRRTRSSTD